MRIRRYGLVELVHFPTPFRYYFSRGSWQYLSCYQPEHFLVEAI